MDYQILQISQEAFHIDEANECYDAAIVNKEWKVQKNDDVVMWEDQTTGCVNFSCDNQTGKMVTGCGKDKLCFEDKCVKRDLLDDKEHVVIIDFDNVTIIELDPFVVVSIISNITSIDVEKIEIAVEHDDEGKVPHILVIVDNETSAKTILEKVNKVSKDPACSSGIICRSTNARLRVKDLSLSGAVTLNNLCVILSAAVMMMLSMMLF